ncbi:MAG: hypothetical protein KBG48_03375 [Kofleriaceae bacterium]|nr:hypothetical protein [Kofleriaceae bacterium]MBP9166395.1 hypothetical protein [Kofleriaceae bacterium]MBP9858636.1 hypothetical protein [Kofleriaceae bacterium]
MKLFASIVCPALAAAVALTSACVISSTPPAPPPTTGGPSTPAGDPMLTPDGRWFAAERTYQGDCAPAGTRGGCYSITLRPDGSFRHMLLDAAVAGTYAIAGAQVTLTPGGDAAPETMTLSADRTKLGDYVLQPAEPPVGQTAP